MWCKDILFHVYLFDFVLKVKHLYVTEKATRPKLNGNSGELITYVKNKT